MHEIKWQVSSLKPFDFMEVKVSRHKRSMSDPIKKKLKEDKSNSISASPYRVKMEFGQPKACIEAKKKQPPNSDIQSSLKQEVLQLQRRLHDQVVVRRVLEKALSYRPLSHDAMIDNSVPKPAQELIKEIAVLELEVVYLEQYLLSLYRNKFDQQKSCVSIVEGRLNKERFRKVPEYDIMSEKEDPVTHSTHHTLPQNSIGNPLQECNDIWGTQKQLDSSIHRSHSSLSQRSACLSRTSPPMKFLNKGVGSYHSLPLSMLEQAQTTTSSVSLAEHLGTCISNHIPETPNWLSEEMIKCISAIYCELADPPLINHDYPSSPIALSSSLNEYSSQGQSDKWSSQCKNFSSFNSNFDNPFHIEGSKEFSGPYCTMAKVQLICRDRQKLREIEYMLRRFRSLVSQLEEVDPRKMKHEEKLAFWINVHNALIMHAFLVYGIPQNNLKRMSVLLKAAYNIGGHTVSVEMIQSSILGCRLPRPGQWLWLLFSSKTKFKVGDARKAYAIEHPEPLLHFALCSGSYSDPAVRIYTSKRVFEELEVAKEEYIQSTFSIRKDQKILLPKIMESFAKDSGLCSGDLVQMIEHFVPDTQRKSIQQCQHKRTWKGIEWTPHNFTFRYMLSKELA
ncbi:uncharacterized protein LOC126706604 isoform X1 [Quercus robur]|uniref:uncharacterized protein LOC126706604 isoform X1 n=1 Tax=Quercus robur TaxID=38942 RepID=UPI002162A325|nr:uncharacterized protein LOC126706604 isoform X1 [Quercus robur]